jgi:hypothetical protein
MRGHVLALGLASNGRLHDQCQDEVGKGNVCISGVLEVDRRVIDYAKTMYARIMQKPSFSPSYRKRGFCIILT